MMYLNGEGKRRELNERGRRLAELISTRVAETNKHKRNGLHMASEGLVSAIDVLRDFHMWTAVAALVETYGFTEREFTEAEYAAAAIQPRQA